MWVAWLQVIVGDESHVYHYEAGGMSVLGGVAFNVIPTLPNGELSLELLQKAVRQVTSLLLSPPQLGHRLLCTTHLVITCTAVVRRHLHSVVCTSSPILGFIKNYRMSCLLFPTLLN